MTNFILAWKFSIDGGFRDFPTRANQGVQIMAVFGFGLMVVFSFLTEFITARKRGRKAYFRVALRNWWGSY